MAADIKKNDDFSKGPISKTVLRLAVPMVLAQFVNVLYNIVDRMYIGHISDTSVDALTGVGVTFPILLMVTAFANLFGTGGTPLFSMARGAAQQGGEEGEKQRERAADVMNNTFSMLVITGVILCMVVLLIKKPVLYLFGASDATYPYADSYLSVYMLGSVFMMVSLGMNGFINAQGFANRGRLFSVRPPADAATAGYWQSAGVTSKQIWKAAPALNRNHRSSADMRPPLPVDSMQHDADSPVRHRAAYRHPQWF